MSDAEARDDELETQIDDSNESNDDPIKNVKSEFNRKFENVSKMIEENNKRFSGVIDQLMSQMNNQQQAPPQNSSDEEDLEDLMYSNPAEFKRRITEQVKGEVTSSLTEQQQAQQQEAQAINEVLTTMSQRFPEYQDQNSDLSQAAIKIYDSLPEHVKKDPASAYKIAMSDAALELGVLPVSKRKQVQSDEDFTLDGGGNSGMGNRRSKSSKKGKVSEATRAFSQLLGQNPDDPKTKERLEKAANRSNWARYRKPGGDR